MPQKQQSYTTAIYCIYVNYDGIRIAVFYYPKDVRLNRLDNWVSTFFLCVGVLAYKLLLAG